MKKYIFSIIAVLILLFCVSSMTYEQQTIVPELQKLLADQPFKEFLSQFHFHYWGMIISVETRGYYYFVEFLIRKALHFFGYGFIAILFLLVYRKFRLPYAALLSLGTIFLLACLDEYHQTFVGGRTGIFDDVLIDTAGAITLIFLYKIFSGIKLVFSKKSTV